MEHEFTSSQNLVVWLQRLERNPESILIEEKESSLFWSSSLFPESYVLHLSDLAKSVENIMKFYQEEDLSLEEYERVCKGFLTCDQKLNYSNADVHSAGMYLFRHLLSIYRSNRQKLLAQLLPRLNRTIPPQL